MVTEKRVLQRRNLIFHLQVVDRETQATIGHVVDITEEGLMLTVSTPVEVGRTYRCRMIIPGGRELEFDATNRWMRPSVNADYHDAGFCFTGLSETEMQAIAGLIERYRMS